MTEAGIWKFATLGILWMSFIGLAHADDRKISAKTGCDSWPTGMAVTYLQNDGLISRGSVGDKAVKSEILSIQPLGKGLYSQMWKLTITPDKAAPITVITRNTFSEHECSISGVDVWVVSKHLGGPDD